MLKAKRGIIRGDTRYTKGTVVEILAYFKTTNEYLVKPVEGQTQCCVKPCDLIIMYPKEILEVLNESNI